MNATDRALLGFTTAGLVLVGLRLKKTKSGLLGLDHDNATKLVAALTLGCSAALLYPIVKGTLV